MMETVAWLSGLPKKFVIRALIVIAGGDDWRCVLGGQWTADEE